MFDELVDDSYAADIGYFGRDRGNQNADQLHHKFLNIVLGRKLREAVSFFVNRKQGEFCYLRNW